MVLTDEQAEIRDVARRFAREKVAPGYQAREAEGAIERRLVAGMGALGLIAPELPEALGGLGQPSVTSGLIAEEIGYADLNVAYAQILGSLNGAILARHASRDLAAEWVGRIVSGEAVVAIGLTEPRGGSDAAALSLSARRDGDHYVVRGEKSSISMADQADAIVTFARTGRPEEGARGISAFLIPMSARGVSTLRFNDLGSKAIGRCSVFFDDVRIPCANRIADEGAGFVQVMQGFDFSRALIGLQCIAAAQASLDESWAYVQERQAFGKPLADKQGVTFPLAEGEGLIAAVRQLCYHTLALRDAGLSHTAEAAMCKWLGPKTAVDVIHQCLLTHGHYGWSLDLPHQQRLRDVMGLEIGDGTAQIMKLIVARERLRAARR
ncbi:acyl-CoA dehydrogenase [Methylobacterium variabile]|jgi:cyclohexanecarboxyl-CoA dehydrogenase|uniref:Acyl-CoA dehydrogenase n=1 Tax=Methylobacterium variabile TaxID=298794 RepID=A0A0J6SP18_9HYPH|nr:acyl-CoA dehydrogenase family protein [Methylobacterium variabile]KMO35377.1 acyl-CoA dehydrogenase [Methylobacterium variabile]